MCRSFVQILGIIYLSGIFGIFAICYTRFFFFFCSYFYYLFVSFGFAVNLMATCCCTLQAKAFLCAVLQIACPPFGMLPPSGLPCDG